MSEFVPALLWFQRRFRKARMAAFISALDLTPEKTVLDVGGTPQIWSTFSSPPRVVMLNMPRALSNAVTGRVLSVGGDGCDLPFADQSFDIVFSNSVIEHLGTAEAQQRFATEAARVGKSYWVQTPSRRFPMETHLLTPFIHWFPKRWARPVIQRFTVWQILQRPSLEQKQWYLQDYLDMIRLLTSGQMRSLFPGAAIRSERFLLLQKSLIAVKKKPHARTT